MGAAQVLQALALLLLPALVLRLGGRNRLPSWLSPVIVCYALGIAAANLGLPLDAGVTRGVVTVAVLLGIPLLLFPADFGRWLRVAPLTARACALSFLAMTLAVLVTAPLFAARVAESAEVGGMLVGTYTGSTPNLIAVATAVGASPDTTALVVTADLLVAGVLCFVVLSPAVSLLRWFLPDYPRPEGETEEEAEPEAEPLERAAIPLRSWAAALGLGVVVVALAGGASQLLPQEHQELAAILGVTTLGVLASTRRPIRELRASPTLGEYWILVFCLGFGTLADVGKLLGQGASGWLIAWTAAVLVVGIALHLAFCWLTGTDRDTAVITTSAAIFGPAMIGPVAQQLKNPELVLSGITAALAGLALGNYLGLLTTFALRAL